MLLYVLAGPTGTISFGFGDAEDIGSAAPEQQCLRHDGFGGCEGDDSIWDVFHEFEELVDEENVYGEYCIKVLSLQPVVEPYQRGFAKYECTVNTTHTMGYAILRDSRVHV